MADRSVLEVKNLTVAYGPHRALEDVSIHVGRGEICVILGANGAGKSTLLKAIAGMVGIAPGGKISNGEKDITGLKPHAIVEAGVALVPEGRGIFGDLTVAENLQLGAYGKQARASERERLQQVLELFPKLGERRSQVARTMSGGEQQMVAIGRALMSNPAILMLDEPSLGLSPLLTKDLFKSLRAVRETGVGILLVEQNAKQSLAIADRGYLLENGHIVGENQAEALARDPAVQAAYLGGAVGHETQRRPLAAAARVPHVAIEAVAEKAGGMAEALARRAAQIQRNYITHRRQGAAPAYMNGHKHGLIDYHIASGEKIYMSEQAQELSRRAADLASHAKKVQEAHLAAMRAGAARAEQASEAASNVLEPAPKQAALSTPAASAGASSARDHAGFAQKVNEAHEAAMRASAERTKQAAAASAPKQEAAKQAAPAAPPTPARPVQDPASFARRVNAAHDAAMRAGAARAAKPSAASTTPARAVSETKPAVQEKAVSEPVPASKGRTVSAPPRASELSRQAAELARHAMQVQSGYLAEERARQARKQSLAGASEVPDLPDSEAEKKARKKRKKELKKELKKALKKLKKELKKLQSADD